MNQQIRIGQLAKRAGCPVETIRYYEREGLVPPPIRTAGNYRAYDQGHAARLAFILNCRSLDMTLEEIRRLLNIRELAQENCAAAHRLLDEHIAHVADRIVELKQLERQLKSLRRQCAPTGKTVDCGILDNLGRGGPRVRRKRPSRHVKGAHPSI